MQEILHEGHVERLIQHEAKLSAVLASRHDPRAPVSPVMYVGARSKVTNDHVQVFRHTDAKRTPSQRRYFDDGILQSSHYNKTTVLLYTLHRGPRRIWNKFGWIWRPPRYWYKWFAFGP